MKPLQFLKSLLPSFGRAMVLDDIRLAKLSLAALAAPAYADSLRLFGNRKFTNTDLKQDWDNYRRLVRGANGANTIVAIEKAFKPMMTTLDLIETLVEKDYNEDIQGAGITYYKAAVLQLLESISFAVDYSMKYLNYVLVIETAELSDDEASVVDEIGAALVPAELRFIKDRFMDFCMVMNTLAKPTETIKTDFASIPDITISESGDRMVQSTVGAAKLDPFMHGLVPLPMNLIYHTRMRYAEWQNERHQQAKAEKEVLELRKLRMERELKGKKDPALEKQIEYTQKRVDDLRDQIRKTEEAYA